MSNSTKDSVTQQALDVAICNMLSSIGGNRDTKRRHLRHDADSLVLYVTQNYEPGQVPLPMNFFPVRCRNLSNSGFSFFFPVRPSFHNLVVQLGGQKNSIYMESQVMHVDPVRDIPEHPSAWDSDGQEHKIRLGSNTFEVGCQFLQRIAVG